MTAKRQNKETGPDPSMGSSAAPRTEILPVTSAVPGIAPRRGGSRFVPGFRFRPADLIILILIFALAGALYYGISMTAAGVTSGTAQLEAVLTVSGEEVWRADISEGASPQSYPVTGIDGHLTVRTEAGRACISYSDCPDQICVLTGWLSSAGQSAVCLPNRCVLTIEAAAGSTGTESSETAAFDIVSK